MKHPQPVFFTALFLLALPCAVFGATCSRSNLTRCLDSVCAINASSNPAARCQYCGTDIAGTPAATAMRSVSVGASSKNTISDKELKSAPSEPGMRYVWATQECLKKLPDCTPDDVDETYDTLIDQSCRASNIEISTQAMRADKSENTARGCTARITACIREERRCGDDYASCAADADFDRFFSECIIESTGCDTFSRDIRTTLTTERTNIASQAEQALDAVIATARAERQSRFDAKLAACTDDAEYNRCVADMCATRLTGGCNSKDDRVMADNLCQFYKTACTTLKRGGGK